MSGENENVWTESMFSALQLLSDQRTARVDLIGVSVLIGIIGTVVLSRVALLEKINGRNECIRTI
jgi:hypothetical protein